MIYLLEPHELDDKILEEQIEAIAQTLCNVHHAVIFDHYDIVCNRHLEEESSEYTQIKNLIPLRIKYKGLKLDRIEQWVKECRANYKKLVDMGLACCDEWIFRNNEQYAEIYNDKIRIMQGVTIQKHKLQPVIEWARDNVPDLPAGQMVATADMPSSEQMDLATPFPLVMPEEYKIGINATDTTNPTIIDSHNRWAIHSYHNYYRANLQKRIKCKECNGEGWHYPKEEVCAHCNQYGSISKITTAKWTRRNPPQWLGFDWHNNIP